MNVSTVLEVCFENGRGMFSPSSREVSTLLEVYFDRANCVFPPSVPEVGFDMLELFFHRAQVIH